MSTKIETVKQDTDGDGVFDEQSQSIFEVTSDGKLWARTDYSQAGWKATLYEYDTAGNNTRETVRVDADHDGHYESMSVTDRAYDADGRLTLETVNSPDFNGDGVPGDYQTLTSFGYDDAGRMISKEIDYLASGDQAPGDYRDEFWLYDDQGRLSEHRLDDPTFFDCEINRFYSYDKGGNLRAIKEQNEIRFGDERPRTDESFHNYDSEGRPTLHTSWADWSDYGWMQRVDTTFTWRDGYDSRRITYDFEGDRNPEAVKFVENWYNSDGNLTHTLISHDPEGDGGPLAGGYDSRDLFVKGWNGDEMVSETRDFGADGVIEYQFTSEWMIA